MDLVRISEDSLQDIKQILNDQNMTKNHLRIHGKIGWGGMSYSLVLDEPADGDRVEEHDGLHFVVKESLYQISQGFSINTEKRGGQTYLSILPNSESADGGNCTSCSSCG